MYSVFALKKKNGVRYLKFSHPCSAWAYYPNLRIDLLNGQTQKFSTQQLLAHWQKFKIQENVSRPWVFHLFYELGHELNHELNRKENRAGEKVGEDNLLALEINYTKVKPHQLQISRGHPDFACLKRPDQEDYRRAFYAGQERLKKGDCYQFNLTCPYVFSFRPDAPESTPEALMALLWHRPSQVGAYAHATIIPSLKKFYLSNSPECLFQYQAPGILQTMPIKGSLAISSNQSWKSLWKKLQDEPKEQAELYMIADLLRNDLARIEKPLAKIIYKKRPLIVPGILHQYALIQTPISSAVTLAQIISSLFPGGSITGAPKRRVMEVLWELEKGCPRGFYCGSTVLLYKGIKAASINIRSAEFCQLQGTFSYGAGGGITLLSQWEKEYREMELKVQSFLNNFFNRFN